jgi:Mor family transcriptional regulator
MADPDGFVDVVLTETHHAARAEGLDASRAARLADAVANRLMLRLGGDSVYIRKVQRVDRAAVLAAFDGRNHRELARVHGVTERRIRQILGEG